MIDFAGALEAAIPATWHMFLTMIGGMFVEQPWILLMLIGILVLAWLSRRSRSSQRN